MSDPRIGGSLAPAKSEIECIHDEIERTNARAKEIATLQSRIRELEEALGWLYQLCIHANEGAFTNGVTDATGSIDEGDVRAGEFIDAARKALGIAYHEPSTERQILCEACQGAGKIEYGHQNAPDAEYERRCEACNGDGWTVEEMEPIEQDDLP